METQSLGTSSNHCPRSFATSGCGSYSCSTIVADKSVPNALPFSCDKYNYTLGRYNYAIGTYSYTLGRYNYTLDKYNYTLDKYSYTLGKYNYAHAGRWFAALFSLQGLYQRSYMRATQISHWVRGYTSSGLFAEDDNRNLGITTTGETACHVLHPCL